MENFEQEYIFCLYSGYMDYLMARQSHKPTVYEEQELIILSYDQICNSSASQTNLYCLTRKKKFQLKLFIGKSYDHIKNYSVSS